MRSALGDVAGALGGELRGDPQTTILDATHDSRAVEPGWLFCAVPGAVVDGHDYIDSAVAAGAAAVLVERPVAAPVPQIIVPDARAAMGPAAAVVHGHPSNELTIVGVTGTNGKSSVVQLVADIWRRAGRREEIYGTLTGARTTPEAPDLQRMLRTSRNAMIEAVAIEVSSHALALSRVDGTRFAAAVFTNLGRDHLDFHGDVESYFLAKAKLFDPGYTDLAVVNLDDPYGRRLAELVEANTTMTLLGYQLSDAADLRIDGPTSRFSWRGLPIVLRLAGSHNVSNALAAATVASALGVDEVDIADALCSTDPVRGRFEMIDVGQPFRIAVDYAHTPDALEAVLGASHQVVDGRVIVVFGCGGDRDQDKRPEMGLVAARNAEVVVITSDNPRSEDPGAIIDSVLAGTEASAADGDQPTGQIVVEPDRRLAIARALELAEPDDLVLIAGKGHETVQVVGSEELPFDDRHVVIEELGAIA